MAVLLLLPLMSMQSKERDSVTNSAPHRKEADS